ncbi:hypothetical protein [Pedobacter sp. Leaf250]|uniref:hypothetical protein n=1 Tax=Pedobacter sp. Leaf250 TaxID=2876559 RepID=UPI001229C669|nr:hypothetical protein [Pedobacter sp. Leaf250]RZL53893.1 MAG: hypothetical protein EOO93_20565 [Pedobacter sp.]
MKTIPIIFCIAIMSASIAGCSNYKPEKGNHYKDLDDTAKKKDSIQPAKRLTAEDTVKKY